jgi:hypothetical protein
VIYSACLSVHRYRWWPFIISHPKYIRFTRTTTVKILLFRRRNMWRAPYIVNHIVVIHCDHSERLVRYIYTTANIVHEDTSHAINQWWREPFALDHNNHRESIIVNCRTGCRVHRTFAYNTVTVVLMALPGGGGSGSCSTDGGHNDIYASGAEEDTKL